MRIGSGREHAHDSYHASVNQAVHFYLIHNLRKLEAKGEEGDGGGGGEGPILSAGWFGS
jgi:hypothetical protein